jgi:hypothetical protein
MFLGTPRLWWIAAGLLFVAALALISTDIGGTLGNVVGVLLLFASIGVFGLSPMRYGQRARTPTTSASPPVETAPPTAIEPPRPRATIEAGDPSDV